MIPINTFNITNIGPSDALNIAIRLVVLFILGVVSYLTLNKRFFALTIFTFGMWLTFFRLTMLRSILLYVGVFKPIATDTAMSQVMYNFLQSSVLSNFISGIVLVGSVYLLFWIKDVYKQDRRQP